MTANGNLIQNWMGIGKKMSDVGKRTGMMGIAI